MTLHTKNILGDLAPEEFLKNYWQKQPCLIRQAIPAYTCPVDPDELAGLACEPDSQARLVIENRHKSNDWQVEYGPFSEETFRQLPSTNWSLLVRHVDRFVPSIQALLSGFDFIPNWRIDDVMISYATDGGSVGPHLDSYDVFLLQGTGRRHWQINRHDYTG
ncbi:MAG TPA: cupin domain-containing protein, partial [Gammaproteobacteria bacterium]|nr:cupin domain-containing protein [Gammaproteobacteria bacterium]